MDKKALRKEIRDQKRAMTEEMIVAKSEKLGELFAASELYQNAKSIYGYLPYNQEVRTVPMLERALTDGKKVAVPKVYGDEMHFIYMDDLSLVEKSKAGHQHKRCGVIGDGADCHRFRYAHITFLYQ